MVYRVVAQMSQITYGRFARLDLQSMNSAINRSYRLMPIYWQLEHPVGSMRLSLD